MRLVPLQEWVQATLPQAALWLKWWRRRAPCLSFQEDARFTDELALVARFCVRLQLKRESTSPSSVTPVKTHVPPSSRKTKPQLTSLVRGSIARTALRRLLLIWGHPTTDNLARCLNAAWWNSSTTDSCHVSPLFDVCMDDVGSRVRLLRESPQTEKTSFEKCSSICATSRAYTEHGHWLLVILVQHTDFSVIATCPSHDSQAVAKKILQHWIRWAGPSGVLLVCRCERGLTSAEAFSLEPRCSLNSTIRTLAERVSRYTRPQSMGRETWNAARMEQGDITLPSTKEATWHDVLSSELPLEELWRTLPRRGRSHELVRNEIPTDEIFEP